MSGLPWGCLAVLASIGFVVLSFVPVAVGDTTSDPEAQVRDIAMQLRCPICQGLSVGDSPSELANEMRTLVREQLQQGKTPAQVLDYFTQRYGEWILLAPPKHGFNLVIWVLPFVLLPIRPLPKPSRRQRIRPTLNVYNASWMHIDRRQTCLLPSSRLPFCWEPSHISAIRSSVVIAPTLRVRPTILPGCKSSAQKKGRFCMLSRISNSIWLPANSPPLTTVQCAAGTKLGPLPSYRRSMRRRRSSPIRRSNLHHLAALAGNQPELLVRPGLGRHLRRRSSVCSSPLWVEADSYWDA
jgi:cytochrome c-type biogenesis protein CcmH